MEPCAMCFGAIAHFRIGRVVSAMDDSLAGVVDMFTDHPYYAARGTEWVRGFRSEDAHELLIEYQLATGQRPHLRSVRRQDRYRLEPDEQS
jgi:tRNA(Arg) A34 adenosine deaminase TadA